MGELDFIREWYAYNSEVRLKYLQALRELPPEQLAADRGASFPSILRIYCHVLEAYNWWFDSVCAHHNGDSMRKAWHDGMGVDEAEAETRWTDDMLRSFLSGVNEEGLQERIRWRRTKNGEVAEIEMRLRDIAWHMVEEELQHRGEINALFWQIDIDPPQTAWDETARDTSGFMKGDP